LKLQRCAFVMKELSRRHFLGVGLAALPSVNVPAALGADARQPSNVRLTHLDLIPVRATARTVWLFVRLHTDIGLSGLGEASDAFGYLNTTKAEAVRMSDELKLFFNFVEGRSPLDIAWFRQQAAPRATAGGLVSATAYSAIEQALWDLSGQLLDQPVHRLLGGGLREKLPVYANINRASKPRTPEGFAVTARQAVADGFRAVKLAPFDGFKRADFVNPAKSQPVADGIACVSAVREAVGDSVQIMIDAHSLFDVPLAIEVAHELEAFRLTWYEEPVSPEMITETLSVRRGIKQPMAAGEILFQMQGFSGLCRNRAVDIIMPDVKHCGGVLELTHIAALAAMDGVAVAPHNPSGPVSTAASVQICAALPNFRILELQWGEVSWRGDLVTPAETFINGDIAVPTRPGYGIALNESLVKKLAL
jgi:galactonate dehydratase